MQCSTRNLALRIQEQAERTDSAAVGFARAVAAGEAEISLDDLKYVKWRENYAALVKVIRLLLIEGVEG